MENFCLLINPFSLFLLFFRRCLRQIFKDDVDVEARGEKVNLMMRRWEFLAMISIEGYQFSYFLINSSTKL